MPRGTIVTIWVLTVIAFAAIAEANTIVKTVNGKEFSVIDRVLVLYAPESKGEIIRVDCLFWDPFSSILDEKTVTSTDKILLSVRYSAPNDRISLINSFVEKGVSAKVIDGVGRFVQTNCLKVVYGAPEGYILSSPNKYVETAVSLYISREDASASYRIPLSEIVRIKKGGLTTVFQKNGSSVSGIWAGPKVQGKAMTVILYGIDDNGTILRFPVNEVASVEFN